MDYNTESEQHVQPSDLPILDLIMTKVCGVSSKAKIQYIDSFSEAFDTKYLGLNNLKDLHKIHGKIDESPKTNLCV